MFDLDGKRMHPADKRNIGIFRATSDDLRNCLEDNEIESNETSCFIKVKGIPYTSTKQDIEEFFKHLNIASDGIIIPLDYKYRMTRDCYVQFASVEDAKKALLLDNEPLSTR